MAFENKKDGSKRDAKAFAIFGKKGKGKSTFLKEVVIQPWYEARLKLYQAKKIRQPPLVIIYDPTFASSFQGYPNISIEELREGKIVGDKKFFVKKGIYRVSEIRNPFHLLEWVLGENGLRNGLLIVDEAQDIGKPVGIPPQLVRELYSRHRNLNNDVYFVYHSPLELHVRLRNKINCFIWFDVGQNLGSPKWFRKKEFPEPELQYEAWNKTYKNHDPDKKMQHFEVVVIPD